MKSYLSLIPISAKVRKRQNRMTVLCIIISVFLVTAIFSVADMMIRTESDFMISNHGNWHIAIKNISQNNADEISNRSDVTAVGVASQFNFEGEQPYRVNEKRTVLYGTDEVYITQISNGIVEGTFPANDEEVMLTPNSVTALGVQLGDSVTLHTPAGDRTFTISGFGTDDESYYNNQTYLIGSYLTQSAFTSVMAQNGVTNAIKFSLGKIDNSLGIHHAVEKKKNWFLMTASFALTIMLVFSFSVILDFAKQLVPSLSVTSADIALSSYANKMDIERSLVDEIKKIDGVANAYGSSYVENIPATSSRAGIDHINIVSYDDTLLDYSKGSIAQGSLDTVYGNSNKVATVFNRNNSLHIGDTIQFAGEEVEITCALSQGLFGDDLIIICSQETFDRIMGDTKYGLIGIQLDSNATEETIAEIRSLENDDIIITDQREGNKQNNATYWAARIVCYGFLAIIGVISLFNIVNSISMSVSARIKQYGAMRAVGMDNRQLKRMISAEAYTYAISGLIVGCGIGLPLSRFLYNRLITHYFGIEWRFPILWFGIVVAFIFISAIVSVYAPAKRIRNMPITATINEL